MTAKYLAHSRRALRILPDLAGTPFAPVAIMRIHMHPAWWFALGCLGSVLSAWRVDAQPNDVITYRVARYAGGINELRQRFAPQEIEILEKLNRADVEHLGQLREVVVPESWAVDELSYATMPKGYPSAETRAKLLIVYLPGQMFGAYESGRLVRWGPVSTGSRSRPTGAGLFHLNWRAVGHTSTVNPDWYMRWYFNFDNREGRAFHQYALPGYPASHGCVRLLERDATWLFHWGDGWILDEPTNGVSSLGTPVLIVGAYDFDAPPPWRSVAWLTQTVVLPPLPHSIADLAWRRRGALFAHGST